MRKSTTFQTIPLTTDQNSELKNLLQEGFGSNKISWSTDYDWTKKRNEDKLVISFTKNSGSLIFKASKDVYESLSLNLVSPGDHVRTLAKMRTSPNWCAGSYCYRAKNAARGLVLMINDGWNFVYLGKDLTGDVTESYGRKDAESILKSKILAIDVNILMDGFDKKMLVEHYPYPFEIVDETELDYLIKEQREDYLYLEYIRHDASLITDYQVVDAETGCPVLMVLNLEDVFIDTFKGKLSPLLLKEFRSKAHGAFPKAEKATFK